MSNDKLRNEARVLAIMAMQSERYGDNADFRDQVDMVYAIVGTADAPPSTNPGELTEEIARKVWHEVWDTGDAPVDIQMAEEEFDTYWVALRKALDAAHTKQEG